VAGFFGPLAGLAGLAANSRSSGQRQAQLDAIEKLKEQGLIQEQQANAMNLQDAASQRAARQKWLDDPNVDPQMKMMISAGLPADAITGYKNQKKDQALSTLNAGVFRLAKGDKAGAMKLAQDAALAGISEAEIKSAFSGTEYFRDPESEEMKALRMLLMQGQLAAQGTKAEKPENLTWRTESVDGKTVQVPYRFDPATGSMSRVPIAGEPLGAPGKLNANQQRLVDSVNDIAEQMPDMKGMIDDLGNPSSIELGIQYAKYRAPFGVGGSVDPKFAAYFNALGQIQTDLIAAATTGGSRSFALIDMLKPHIPDPTDPPSRAMEKLKGFDMGRFNAIRKTLLGEGPSPGSRPMEGAGGTDPASTAGFAPGPAAMPKGPVAMPAKYVRLDSSGNKVSTGGSVAVLIGTDPRDGKPIYQASDGKKYKVE